MVCVDYFTKWVEMRTLVDKTSAALATFFYEDIVCRYGQPALVRSDNGSEFDGAFKAMCTSLGIEHAHAGPHHPRAMGQVERMNRTIKALIT